MDCSDRYENVSARYLVTDALEAVAESSEEYKLLKRYEDTALILDEKQTQLADVRSEIQTKKSVIPMKTLILLTFFLFLLHFRKKCGTIHLRYN